MKKIILGGVLLVLALAAIAGWWYWTSRPQVITLKNGNKLTLVGVSYGKHHVFKGAKTATGRTRGHAVLDTTNDTLVVWIETEYKPNEWPNYNLLVYDPANTACVGAWQRMGNQIKSGMMIQGFALDAYPRRESKMILRVMAWGMNGQETAKGQFVISNPGPRSFPDWQPEPMPDEQSDGDLDVTLTRCVANARGFMYGNQSGSSKDPKNRAVELAFHTEQNGSVVTNWQPVAVQTTDATGNQASMNSWSQSLDTNDDATMTYQWGLWPNEKAWKLRVEMSRTSGFSNDEVWAVSDLPIKKGNQNDLWSYQWQQGHTETPVAETDLQGFHLKIFTALRTDMNYGMGQKSGGFRVSASPDLPAGFRMSVTGITDENGHKLPPSWGPNDNNGSYIFQLPDVRDAKSLNLTIAVHRSRFVEYTVKPTEE
jgi:hypothetical protein